MYVQNLLTLCRSFLNGYSRHDNADEIAHLSRSHSVQAGRSVAERMGRESRESAVPFGPTCVGMGNPSRRFSKSCLAACDSRSPSSRRCGSARTGNAPRTQAACSGTTRFGSGIQRGSEPFHSLRLLAGEWGEAGKQRRSSRRFDQTIAGSVAAAGRVLHTVPMHCADDCGQFDVAAFRPGRQVAIICRIARRDRR